jgi:predicted GNAT superfamily acetyltransferase
VKIFSPNDIRAQASKLARQAGVSIRLIGNAQDALKWAAVTDSIWQMPSGANIVEPSLLVALSHSGNYVAAAYDAGEVVGVCMGFWHEPEKATLHSHLAGVPWERIGQGIGRALKFHQAAWLLDQGAAKMTWAFDPLVARNAHFYLNTLGVRPLEYLPDFYGPMADALNAGHPTDRLLVHWDLLQRKHPAIPEVVSRVPIPPDIETLRRTSPAEADAFVPRLRETLAQALADGQRIVGFDRDSCSYLLA